MYAKLFYIITTRTNVTCIFNENILGYVRIITNKQSSINLCGK